MSSLIFNGHDFATLFVYGDPKITVLNAKPVTREVNGRDGEAFVGLTYGASSVAFTIAAIGGPEERRTALSTLGGWLKVDGPKPLYLPDTPDRYYLAVPDGALDLARCIDGELATVTFMLTDPVAYGDSHTAALASGGTATINVSGTAPTYLNVSADSATRNSSSLVWGVRVDSQDYVHVATGTSSPCKVEIDSGERVCKVANAVTLPTLDSDWLKLEPGTHTVAMDHGTGAATLSWTARWY